MCTFILYLSQFIIQKERKQGRGRGRETERKINRWLSCGYTRMTILQTQFIGNCLVLVLWFVCWGPKYLGVRETNHTCESLSFRVNSTAVSLQEFSFLSKARISWCSWAPCFSCSKQSNNLMWKYMTCT